MDLILETISPLDRVRSISVSEDSLLLHRQQADGRYSIRWAELREGSWELRLGDDAENCENIEHSLGSFAIPDSQKRHVYASLGDEKRVAKFALSEKQKLSLAIWVSNLDFQGRLLSLTSFPRDTLQHGRQLIVAISTIGEILFLCEDVSGTTVQKKIFQLQALDRVLSVSESQEGFLLVLGISKSKLCLAGVKVERSATLADLNAQVLPTVALPSPPPPVSVLLEKSENVVLGFVIEPFCGFILFGGGFVHVITPHRNSHPQDGATLDAWFGCKMPSSEEFSREIKAPKYAFRLSEYALNDQSAALKVKSECSDGSSFGSIARLCNGYVAIGYGHYISIWDGLHGVGHGMVHTNGNIRALQEGVSITRVIAATEDSLQEVIADSSRSNPPSLGLAMKRRGACDAIIAGLEAVETAPIRFQPVTVGPLKAAADAGGNSESIFQRVLEAENGVEVKLVRKLLSRKATQTAEAVIALIREYTISPNRKVRRGNHGEASNLGLAKLPSERVAAVTVARCLFEIYYGDLKYLVPLIDMVGTGVVSAEAVLSVLDVSDTWAINESEGGLSLTSIIEPLTSSDKCVHAIEAIVRRVTDLPEEDMVRLIQFATRLSCGYQTNGTGKVEDAEAGNIQKLMRNPGHTMLRRCLQTRPDRMRVIESIKRVPFTDVIAILEQIEGAFRSSWGAVDTGSLTEVPPEVRLGYFCEAEYDEEQATAYRGLRNWIDKESGEKENVQKEYARNCIEWACHFVDAHLSSLILDSSGRELAQRWLPTARQRRSELETLKGIQGLVFHITEGKGLPEENDPMHEVRLLEVPGFAAML